MRRQSTFKVTRREVETKVVRNVVGEERRILLNGKA